MFSYFHFLIKANATLKQAFYVSVERSELDFRENTLLCNLIGLNALKIVYLACTL
jgi:hypothetical protein